MTNCPPNNLELTLGHINLESLSDEERDLMTANMLTAEELDVVTDPGQLTDPDYWPTDELIDKLRRNDDVRNLLLKHAQSEPELAIGLTQSSYIFKDSEMADLVNIAYETGDAPEIINQVQFLIPNEYISKTRWGEIVNATLEAGRTDIILNNISSLICVISREQIQAIIDKGCEDGHVDKVLDNKLLHLKGIISREQIQAIIDKGCEDGHVDKVLDILPYLYLYVSISSPERIQAIISKGLEDDHVDKVLDTLLYLPDIISFEQLRVIADKAQKDGLIKKLPKRVLQELESTIISDEQRYVIIDEIIRQRYQMMNTGQAYPC